MKNKSYTLFHLTSEWRQRQSIRELLRKSDMYIAMCEKFSLEICEKELDELVEAIIEMKQEEGFKENKFISMLKGLLNKLRDKVA